MRTLYLGKGSRKLTVAMTTSGSGFEGVFGTDRLKEVPVRFQYCREELIHYVEGLCRKVRNSGPKVKMR